VTNHDDRTVLRLGRLLWRSGHRLGEIVSSPSGEINYLTRSCVTYSIAGVLIVDPSITQLSLLRPGDFILLAPCASKPDQFGEEHCPFPSILPVDGQPLSAATSICHMEHESPCHGAPLGHSTPLFSTASGLPYTYALRLYAILNRRLHQFLHAVFGRGIADTLSWHSIRIGLACALHAAACPDATIQLICRWASPESLKLYRVFCVRGFEHTNFIFGCFLVVARVPFVVPTKLPHMVYLGAPLTLGVGAVFLGSRRTSLQKEKGV